MLGFRVYGRRSDDLHKVGGSEMTIQEVVAYLEKLISNYEQGLSTPEDLRRGIRILAILASQK